jgi:hypothetical protein
VWNGRNKRPGAYVVDGTHVPRRSTAHLC